MSIEQMRVYISQHPKYNSPAWRDKCNRMPDGQVIAIYHNFKKQDYSKVRKEMKQTEKENQKYHQINMFEYMEGLV